MALCALQLAAAHKLQTLLLMQSLMQAFSNSISAHPLTARTAVKFSIAAAQSNAGL